MFDYNFLIIFENNLTFPCNNYIKNLKNINNLNLEKC